MNYNLLNILEIEDNFCDCLIRAFILLGHIMNIIKIVIPIIIILLGSIDFIKAMIAQKDDEMKKAQTTFIKRLIYGVVVFFVISIVAFLIGLVGGDTNNRCFKCVADVNGKDCDKKNIPKCRKVEEIEKPEVPEVTPEPVPNPEPETPDKPEEKPKEEKKEPNLTGWNCSEGSQEPVNGCRVHFSDILIGSTLNNNDKQDFFTIKSYDESRNTGVPGKGNNDILGKGKYSDSSTVLLNSYKAYIKGTELTGLERLYHSLDTIAVDQNTKLIYYNEKNFKGKFYEIEGPTVIFGKNRPVNEINQRIANSRLEYNGVKFKSVISEEPFVGTGTQGEINMESFMICCKN